MQRTGWPQSGLWRAPEGKERTIPRLGSIAAVLEWDDRIDKLRAMVLLGIFWFSGTGG